MPKKHKKIENLYEIQRDPRSPEALKKLNARRYLVALEDFLNVFFLKKYFQQSKLKRLLKALRKLLKTNTNIPDLLPVVKQQLKKITNNPIIDAFDTFWKKLEMASIQIINVFQKAAAPMLAGVAPQVRPRAAQILNEGFKQFFAPENLAKALEPQVPKPLEEILEGKPKKYHETFKAIHQTYNEPEASFGYKLNMNMVQYFMESVRDESDESDLFSTFATLSLQLVRDQGLQQELSSHAHILTASRDDACRAGANTILTSKAFDPSFFVNRIHAPSYVEELPEDTFSEVKKPK